jgi:hypothetical protein
MESFEANKEEPLRIRSITDEIEWVKNDTAILVIHGIGNQLPLETLDQFGRGLIKTYKKGLEDEITISHQVVDKPDSRGGVWFDNILRISKKGSEHTIDIYEYYWANYSEDKATWRDINSWIQGVVSGAKIFYKRNAQLGYQYKDKSPFFDSKTGAFNASIYNFFISVASKIVLTIDAIIRGFIWLVARIPFLGGIAESLLKSYADNAIQGLTNVIGDVVVYNVSDPKSKFYTIKKRIQEGAIRSLKFIVERDKGDQPFYPSIFVAGHSLGSQVAYDAINRINLLINQNQIKGYSKEGINDKTKRHISTQLKGFITFGCPLDKIIFFLRENVPDDQYIRQQFLDHFNGFKQRDVNFSNNPSNNQNYIKANSGLNRHLENMQWRNYYDGRDYVSGGLDYYRGLTNIDCQFKSGTLGFTHSYYWDCEAFYQDIIIHFLK